MAFTFVLGQLKAVALLELNYLTHKATSQAYVPGSCNDNASFRDNIRAALLASGSVFKLLA